MFTRLPALVLALTLAACGGQAPQPDGGRAPATTPSATATATLAANRAAGPPSSTAASSPVGRATGFGNAPTGPTQQAQVIRIIDGDTIKVSIEGIAYTVRYIGVDTPETVHPSRPVEFMGPEASAANRRLVEGRMVVLERDVSETDRHGRLLRYVWLQKSGGWVLVNLELLRRGLATVVTHPPDVKYVDALYLPAQERARDAGRGVWGAAPSSSPSPAPPTTAPTASPSATPAVGTSQQRSMTVGPYRLTAPALN